MLRAAADLVVVVHAAFVVFVVLGALLVVRGRQLIWVHVPAALWGVLTEIRGWTCPLTPLEQYLRQRSGSSAYQGEFIEHYLLPLLYPAGLTRDRQIWLGSVAILINVFLYWYVLRTARRSRGRNRLSPDDSTGYPEGIRTDRGKVPGNRLENDRNPRHET